MHRCKSSLHRVRRICLHPGCNQIFEYGGVIASTSKRKKLFYNLYTDDDNLNEVDSIDLSPTPEIDNSKEFMKTEMKMNK